MKRMFELAAIALLLVASSPQAVCFNGLVFFNHNDAKQPSDSAEGEAANADSASVIKSAAFVISKFDDKMTSEFRKAWASSGGGTASRESVVLILRMADGSFGARSIGATNEYKKVTFAWHPATIAVIHTHPNSSSPQPQDDDLTLADKHGVPVFTITSRGMYVYDPTTKKVSKVQNNLDWADPKKWTGEIALH
ncbi:MAG TPA: hypothetical protein VNN73_19830 [Blastocatellia bacterium]|nr:hypothetical protein [Blastocatellia bacterium]